MLKYVETNKAPAAIGPYSQGIVVNGTAFFSGQIPLSPETGEVIGTTIREQTEQVMKNIQGLLESQNASFTDVKDLPKGVLCEVETIAVIEEN